MFLAETYFDEREQRTKPVPDCIRVGAAWDRHTQRCERPRAAMNNDGLGLLAPDDQYEFDDGDGLGFLPAAAAAGPSIWAGLTAVGGAIGGFFSQLFGGDDQKTNYRPPANSAQQFVQFNDQHGSEYVAYDLSQASLAEAARRGNRADDIFSYYSAFISNSTSAGASSAAKRVLEDAAKKNQISIARAADWILNTAGVTRIVQSFLPSNQDGGSSSAPAHLPPYCPGDTYHPYPIGHPQQDLCVPFPGWENGHPQGTPKPPASAAGGLQIPRCPTGQAPYPLTLKCVPIQCPTGTRRNPLSGFCLKTSQQGALPQCPDSRQIYDLRTRRCLLPGSAEAAASEAADEKESLGDSGDWLWLLLIVGGVLMVSQRR